MIIDMGKNIGGTFSSTPIKYTKTDLLYAIQLLQEILSGREEISRLQNNSFIMRLSYEIPKGEIWIPYNGKIHKIININTVGS